MKIAVNAQFLHKPNTGMGQYLKNILPFMLEIDQKNEYVLYSEAPVEKTENMKMQSRVLRVPFYQRDDLIRKTIWEKIIFPKAARKDRADLVWSPYFSTSNITGIPHAMTIHDVIYKIFPQYVPNTRWKIYYQLSENAARNARQVVTISQCSKKDITKFLGIQEEKIKVTYLGKPENNHSEFQAEKLDSAKDYILYLGGFDYRKNVATLLRAYKKFSEFFPDISLVVLGKLPDPSNPLAPDLKNLVTQLSLDSKVIFPGYVKDNDLPAWYKNAKFFVYPTLYEGFGLPVLEAMGYGCPVVTSKNSSITEIAGDAAILIDSANPQEITDAMVRVVKDDNLRKSMIKKGLENVKRFSWKKCAMETVEIFHALQ